MYVINEMSGCQLYCAYMGFLPIHLDTLFYNFNFFYCIYL